MSNDNPPFPDRAVEKQILERLFSGYPNQVEISDWENEFPSLVKEMSYLHDHGLVKAVFSGGFGAREAVAGAELTKDGVDFLQGDGGLSAILGTVTIKIHDDTIKNLIEAKIVASDLPQPDKQRFLDRLRSLPADATKHLALKLLEKGLDAGPSAWTAIQTFLSAHT